MLKDVQIIKLAAALAEAGWSVALPSSKRPPGFMWPVYHANGACELAILPEIPLLDRFGEDRLGVAMTDEFGNIVHQWGQTRSLTYHEKDLTVTPLILSVVRTALRGRCTSVLIDNHRVQAQVMDSLKPAHVIILVTNAREEADAVRRADLSARKADTLKMIGKALTMHQTLQPMTVAAAHAISAAADLGAVLLWIAKDSDSPLELIASVGADRFALEPMAKIELGAGSKSAAHLCANRRKPVIIEDVHSSRLTDGLESTFCVTEPGAMMVWPLILGQQTIGLLEVVSKRDDKAFLESQDLYATIAEHLALAFRSAMLFEQAEQLASFDPLTGVANHRTMQDFLASRVEEAKRSHGTVGAIMIDVDNFRRFNEEEGHDAGDLVLKLVAGVLKSQVRPYDLAARYGGEEFTVIMPGVSSTEILAIAERIRTGIEALPYQSENGVKRTITASMGCALYPLHAVDAGSLLKSADQALYEVKRTTRNRCLLAGSLQNRPGVGIENEILVAARRLVPQEQTLSCESMIHASNPFVARISNALHMSANQVKVLESAAFLLPVWTKSEVLRSLETNVVFRPVLGCLSDIDERFDGSGPKHLQGSQIPLLSRILAFIRYLVQNPGAHKSPSPGHFDPSVVEVLTDSNRAA